jgi:ABC-type amino acid transport substrate-binding protein
MAGLIGVIAAIPAAGEEGGGRHRGGGADMLLLFATPLDEGRFTIYMRAVFDELGNRIGIPCMLVELPKKRCLVDADRGLYDGVAARVSGLQSRGYPNLIQVSASHYTVQHVVFARPPLAEAGVSDIAGLVETSLLQRISVAYLHGSKKAEELLTGLPAAYKTALNLPEQAFRMLAKGRVCAYLAGPGIVNRAVLKRMKAAAPGSAGMQEITEVFVASESLLYPYVHARHAPLVTAVTAALRGMADDGTLDNLFHAAWWPVLP